MSTDVVFPRREFYMVRHGETEHNAAKLLSNHYTLLTKNGQAQAGKLQQVHDAHFPDPGILYYVSSAMPRAIETCRIMTGDKPHVCIPELNERVSGRASGLMRQQFFDNVRKDKDYLEQNKIRLRRVGMQFDDEHAAIAVPAVCRVVEQCPQGMIPMIVSHSGTMRHTAQYLGIENATFGNAQMYHFTPVGRDGWEVTHVVLQHGKSMVVPLAAPTRQEGLMGLA